MIMVTWVTESNNYSLDIVYAMLRDASAILTGTTHKSSPLISEVVTYMYSQYTFYGRIFYFLTMPSSSSAGKPPPSRARATLDQGTRLPAAEDATPKGPSGTQETDPPLQEGRRRLPQRPRSSHQNPLTG